MVNNGSFDTSSFTLNGGTTAYLRFNWSISSQYIANNETLIDWTLVGITNRTSTAYYFKSGAFRVVIDSETVYQTSQDDRIELYNGRVVASGTKVIKHDEDGNKNFSAYAEAGIYYYAVNCSGSGSWDLTPISRYATISIAPDFNDDENPTITYKNPAGENINLLTACISLDGSSETVSYRELSKTATSYTFELTEDERNVLRDAVVGSNSRTVYFILKTVIGESEHKELAPKVYSIHDGKPILNPTVEDSNPDTIALTGDANLFIRYYSNAAYEINAEAKKRATIISRRVTCGGKSSIKESGTLENVEEAVFVFSVIDSRENPVSEQVTKTLIDYVRLTCDLYTNNPDGDGNMDFYVKGNCFKGSFGLKENAVQVFYRYKENNGEYREWIEAEVVLNDDNTYRADVSLSGLSYLNKYTFQAKAIDMLETIESVEKPVKAIPVFDWGENDFSFNVPVKNLMLASPNGTVYKILVSDSGVISTTIIN